MESHHVAQPPNSLRAGGGGHILDVASLAVDLW